MTVKMAGLFSSLKSVWQDFNPLAPGVSFSTQDFLEDRVYELEQEVQELKRALSQATAQLEWPQASAPAECRWQGDFRI